MLVYLAVAVPGRPSEQLVVGGLLLREPDLPNLKAVVGGEARTGLALDQVLRSAPVVQLLGLIRDVDLIDVASTSRCFEGLYLRIARTIQHTQGSEGPVSIFVYVMSDSETYAYVSLGLATAAKRFDAHWYLFVEPATLARAGAGCHVAGQVADLLSEQPERSVDMAAAFKPEGFPSGLIHYTLDYSCPCLACRNVKELVQQPLWVEDPPPRRSWNRHPSVDH